MKAVLLSVLLLCSFQTYAAASCKYEARIRLGLVWFTVDVVSSKPLTRKQVIARLHRDYNFHDVGSIYEVRECSS